VTTASGKASECDPALGVNRMIGRLHPSSHNAVASARAQGATGAGVVAAGFAPFTPVTVPTDHLARGETSQSGQSSRLGCGRLPDYDRHTPAAADHVLMAAAWRATLARVRPGHSDGSASAATVPVGRRWRGRRDPCQIRKSLGSSASPRRRVRRMTSS
jgi:hypothetical protein